MMRPGGIMVALAMYWLAGVVGAASLPPDDQYSPQSSPYRRDFAHGPRGYPNWLQYRQDSNREFGTELFNQRICNPPAWNDNYSSGHFWALHPGPTGSDEALSGLTRTSSGPDVTLRNYYSVAAKTQGTGVRILFRGQVEGHDPPETEPGVTTLKASDLSWESKARKDTALRDANLSALSPRRWSVASTGVNDNFTEGARSNPVVPEDSDVSSASREEPFTSDDTFQDQGPGSVEVYKLDLLRENSLLVPEARKRQRQPTTKSKIPKKAPPEEILWKLKPIEPSKASFPAIFRQPPRLQNRKDEVFAVGGVPELQVGCEGLEATERRRRSSAPTGGTSDEDSENWHEFKIPVYKESTEPILSRVTPIVLDFEEEPPSGEVYEEMDELLKLKNLESTSPAPTTRRRNRADIDPALAIHHSDDRPNVETFPERGDLGPVSNASKVKRSIAPGMSQDGAAVGAKRRTEDDLRDEDTSSAMAESPSGSPRQHGGRRLLWAQRPGGEVAEDRARGRKRRADNDLWGFGEDDGAISGGDDESEAEQLRRAEVEKRRREYERRRQEELERRRGGHGHRGHSHEQRTSDANSEAERIRAEYERQLEKEQRERQRVEEERRAHGDRRHREEEERRRAEEAMRRRMEEDERDRRNRPSPLTRPEQPRRDDDNRSRSRQEDREAEERKLREYIARNRPIDPRSREDRGRAEGESRWRNDDEERRRHVEEERRRHRMEEHRRRQQHPDDDERRRQRTEEHRRRQQQLEEEERRRQMEEHRRRQQQPDEEERRRQMEEQRRRQQQPDEEERRRQMEEQRRRQHSDEYERRRMEEERRRHRPDEEEQRRRMEEERRRSRPDNRTTEDERRRRLEEERKLQDYVRRNQPVNVPRRNTSEDLASRERDLDEQRRTLEAARQYERNRVESSRMNAGRSHGPSAPANIGHRQSHSDLEEMRRRQEAESERRRLEDEERRREEEYRRIESRRREEERLRLEEMRRKEENRRSQSASGIPSWRDSGSSRRPANTPHRGGGGASGEVRHREAEALRRQEAAGRTSMRNPENEWRRRADERERLGMENERNSRNNGRRGPQHGDTGFEERRQRGGAAVNSEERRRREHERLSSLPVSARIVLRSNDGSRPAGGSRVAVPPTPSFDSRANFDNDIGFPSMNPHRQGLPAARFPAPVTRRPPVKSPGACVWAIVQCCPANNRLTSCFESMGCPGSNWDPNPCRGSLADAARAEVVRFYKAVEDDRRGI